MPLYGVVAPHFTGSLQGKVRFVSKGGPKLVQGSEDDNEDIGWLIRGCVVCIGGSTNSH